ncbi:MAG TPA: GrpB family protein [Candidatus Blautia merdipullorum]|nr:GrpB family protein [Candidatus Blautia merdipullorum]
MLPYVEVLKQHHIVFRGEIITGEILFVIGSDEVRTHHIHIVRWNGTEWNNYINFRDYLNAYPEKAVLYDTCK